MLQSLVDINRYSTPTLRAYSRMFRLLSAFDRRPQAQELALTRIGNIYIHCKASLLKVNKVLVLRPSCVPEKVGVIQRWHSHNKQWNR
jgi:hypothetical protein